MARAIPPGELPGLSYWPFATYAEIGTPLLTQVHLDVVMADCSVSPWAEHPIAESRAQGPFCVGLVEQGSTQLLIVGRLGEEAYLLLPGWIEREVDGPKQNATIHRRLASAAIVAQSRQWVRSQEDAR